MSIRPATVDNHGTQPCLDPVALGRAMERICNGHVPSLAQRAARALANLRKKLAR